MLHQCTHSLDTTLVGMDRNENLNCQTLMVTHMPPFGGCGGMNWLTVRIDKGGAFYCTYEGTCFGVAWAPPDSAVTAFGFSGCGFRT